MEGDALGLVLRGKPISQDEMGNVCLNDLWRMAGGPDAKRPSDWYRGQRAKALRLALAERIAEDFGNSLEKAENSTYYVAGPGRGRGRGSRTFAHRVLALDYAEYLEPDLGVEIRETFLRARANDITLALEIVEGLAEQAEYDALRVKLRQLVKEHNKMSAGAAKAAGVTNFEAYNGAGLAGLYGGMNKAAVLTHKGLPRDAHHLDHAGHEELAANYFKATQAVAKLTRDANAGIKGQAHANKVHMEIGEGVRDTIRSFGGTMPEDEPALEHIKQAEKRLKAAQAMEQKALPRRSRG